MKAALILLLVATVLALYGRAFLRKAAHDGDGGMGYALLGVALVFLAVMFGAVALVKALT